VWPRPAFDITVPASSPARADAEKASGGRCATQDEGPLKFLVDISCSELTGEDEDGDPLRGFKLDFTFMENPYFSNRCELVVWLQWGSGCWVGRCGRLAAVGPARGSLYASGSTASGGRMHLRLPRAPRGVLATVCARPPHSAAACGCRGDAEVGLGAAAAVGSGRVGVGVERERCRLPRRRRVCARLLCAHAHTHTPCTRIAPIATVRRRYERTRARATAVCIGFSFPFETATACHGTKPSGFQF
jgi:hypothetical protein